jgi:hypothetical protein
MDSKLTLKLNQNVIEKAKQYAADQNLSLSRLVEFYFQSLTSQKNDDDSKISPFVKSIAKERSRPRDVDDKKEITDYLMEKYK